MGRGLAYGIGLWCVLGTSAMTLASIIIPEWITWDTQTPASKKIHYTYGLHQRCSSIDQSCTPFPRWEDCQGPERAFCSLWRTTGFLLSFAFVLELATIITFCLIILGGKQRLENGWKTACTLLMVVVVAQAVGMGLVVDVFRKDERFFDGWKLDRGFVLATVSWVVQVLVAVGVTVACYVLPEEGGYELIPDRLRDQ